jgi:hypothetical protein
MTNETYEITIKSPLIRPGIEIRTNVSGKYLVKTLKRLLDDIREFNNSQNDQQASR